MQGICGALSSDLLANWVGAIGSAGAAILAVVLYWHDKRHQRRENAKERATMRRAQSRRVVVYLEFLTRRLSMILWWAKNEAVTHEIEKLLVPPSPEMAFAFGDPSVFERGELDGLAELSLMVIKINHGLLEEGHPVNANRTAGNMIPAHLVKLALEHSRIEKERFAAIANEPFA